jgi:hypothetical protein
MVTLYIRTIEFGEKLFFAPNNADEIAVYDTKTCEFIKIALPEAFVEKIPSAEFTYKCTDMFLFDELIYIVCFCYPAILKVDPHSLKVEMIADFGEDFRKIGADLRTANASGILIDDTIVLAFHNSNALVFFNTKDNSYNIKSVGNINNKYGALCFDGTHLWLAPFFDGAIVRYNPRTDECFEINEFPAGYKPMMFNFIGIIFDGAYLRLTSGRCKTALKVDPKNLTVSVDNEFQQFIESENGNWGDSGIPQYFYSYSKDNIIYAFSYARSSMITYNTQTRESKEIPIFITAKERRRIHNDAGKIGLYKRFEEPLIHETDADTLNCFLEFALNESTNVYKTNENTDDSLEQTAGKRIFDNVKNTVFK